MSQDSIRNFAVISHIDHGKTTLTDRFLEITNSIADRSMKDRLLDSNPIERERGITIKLAPVRMNYTQSATRYTLNLIDTPGHVDFSYEVSRSLAACEGAILLVDGTQGIQAQTLANAYLAIESDLTIIPVINKVDLSSADIDSVTQQLQQTLSFAKDERILSISAKTGKNVSQLLEKVIEKIPPPKGKPTAPLRALVFNSYFDQHKGVIAAVKVVDGSISQSDKLKLMANSTPINLRQLGYFAPHLVSSQKLKTGEVGFIATGLKDVSQVKVGDTITSDKEPATLALAGYNEPKPVVFMELYPLDGKDFTALKDALEKLKLNDAALVFESVNSPALGNGVRVGFLGLLHAEIVQERLEREFTLDLIATTPTVKHLVTLTSGKSQEITSASSLPEPNQIATLKEPFITLYILTPAKYLGDIITITQKRRAKLIDQKYYGNRVKLIYRFPLAELITGYYDELKSVSSGFASLDYQIEDYQQVDAVKLSILVNKLEVKPLASIVVRSSAEARGRQIVSALKEVIPKQQFEVPIQAALGGKILARATLKALRKDVTAKLYGGDQTRKDKLLKKQKKGKKRMKRFGKVEIPQSAFLAVLKK